MIKHNFTLAALLKEFNSLIGLSLAEIFTQEKDSCVLYFDKGDDFIPLQFDARPGSSSIYLRRGFRRAGKNTVDIFDDLKGEVLQEVILIENNRIFEFRFINTILIAHIFGGPNSNIFVLTPGGRIIDSLKNKDQLIGSNYEKPVAGMKSFWQFQSEDKIINQLAKSDLKLGKYYAREFCTINEIDPDSTIDSFSERGLLRMESEAKEFADKIVNSDECFILKDKKDNFILSLIPLTAYPETILDFDSVSDAISRKISSYFRDKTFITLKKEIQKKIDRGVNKNRKNLELMQDEAPAREREIKYRLYAELLAAVPNPRQRPGKEITLTNYDGTDISVPLDEKKNLIENSSRYYDKARSTKEELNVRKKRIPEIKARFDAFVKAKTELEKLETVKALEKFELRNKDLLGIKNLKKNMTMEDKFRQFDLGDGFMLYVGKNAANNDELTMRFAKPNDIWLHARGSGGSHAVIRIDKGQKPNKQIIKKAAAVAAYYSQARKAKYTPVAYTFKKYVRKPKGANTGSVVIAREEVVMVSPGLPAGYQDE